MIPRALIIVICVSALVGGSLSRAVLATGLSSLDRSLGVEQKLNLRNLHSFTFDENGALWTASGDGRQAQIRRFSPAFDESQLIAKVSRNEKSDLNFLVTGTNLYVSSGDRLHHFGMRGGKSANELPSIKLPHKLRAQITSLAWNHDGNIMFSFSNRTENGFGFIDPRSGFSDIFAMGLAGDSAFDEEHGVYTYDRPSQKFFRVAPGLDYEKGLQPYSKADLAFKTPEGGFSAFTIYTGDNWPAELRGALVAYDQLSRRLQAFRVGLDRSLSKQIDVASVAAGTSLSQLQIGPDGALWMLVRDSNRPSETTIVRIHGKVESSPNPALLSMGAAELVNHLGSANSWRRDAALRALAIRQDFAKARGLHPHTPLHHLAGEATNFMARRYALRAQHHAGLLDEGALENATEETNALVRMEGLRLLAERRTPTVVAFQRTEKMAQDKSLEIRLAVLAATRHYVSGSLALDTTPPVAIREVFTGPMMSTLWFSTEHGSSPEFDLLYWNALRPITAFDSVHALGFFQGDGEEQLPLAHFIVERIAHQALTANDPLKLEETVDALKLIKPGNRKLLATALQGFVRGLPDTRVCPTAQTIRTLAGFADTPDDRVSAPARVLLRHFSR